MTAISVAVLLLATGAADALAPVDGSSWGAATSRTSVSSTGEQANAESFNTAISGGGRYAVFASMASNLVAGDTNGALDVFVRDRLTGVTQRVSVGRAGRQGNERSGYGPSISADGRYVAFDSRASNLVAGDTNGSTDIFVRDLRAGVTRRVSVGRDGRQANSSSFYAMISADGRSVAFVSGASNLVARDTNFLNDAFVRDLVANRTERVSVGPGGVEANETSFFPAISSDGRYVAFGAHASNLVAGDTNGVPDVFVRDRLDDVTRRVSVGRDGRQGNKSSYINDVSANGRYIAFSSYASNLVAKDTNRTQDVFVRDRATRVTRLVSVGTAGRQANGESRNASLSANGRFVAFGSEAPDLVPNDTNEVHDVFVRDRLAGVTRRVSVGPRGRQANESSGGTAISADGRQVAFSSGASNLVPGDTNDVTDVFVRDRAGDRSR